MVSFTNLLFSKSKIGDISSTLNCSFHLVEIEFKKTYESSLKIVVFYFIEVLKIPTYLTCRIDHN